MSLNFQISLTIVVFCGMVAAGILSFIGIGFLLFPLVMLLGLAGLILAIIAGIKANNGEDYKYPWSLDVGEVSEMLDANCADFNELNLRKFVEIASKIFFLTFDF